VTVGGDVFHNRLHRFARVAQPVQGSWNRLVDDLHRTSTDKLLELDERKVRLDSGRVAIHHEADSAGWREHARLCIAPPVDRALFERTPPLMPGPVADEAVHRPKSLDLIVRNGVLAHHSLVCGGIGGEARISADDLRELGGPSVGRPRHQ